MQQIKIQSTAVPVGAVPYDFESWRNFIKNELFFLYMDKFEILEVQKFSTEFMVGSVGGPVMFCQSINERIYV